MNIRAPQPLDNSVSFADGIPEFVQARYSYFKSGIAWIEKKNLSEYIGQLFQALIDNNTKLIETGICVE